MLSASVVGGVAMIGGAFWTFTGHIQRAICAYLVADLCWIYMAYLLNDWFGLSVIVIGTLFGIGALFRMRLGHLFKTIIPE